MRPARLSNNERNNVEAREILTVKSNELAPYMETAKRFPMLTAAAEQSLFARWREQGDQDALQQLAGSHLRLVIKIARENSGYGLPVGDLIAEGNVGLMQAAGKFDVQRGVRFATYAAWWIRAAIREYVLRSRSLVKMGTTAAQKKLFFNLGRLKNKFRVYDNGDLDPQIVGKIAEALGVPEGDVVEMNARLSSGDCSLNATIGGQEGSEFQELLVDEGQDPEQLVAEADELAQRRTLLGEAFKTLSVREQHILQERKLSEEPLTLADLSQHYGISRERVRQIEARAIDRLREKILAAANEASSAARGQALAHAA
jgi:RNA polymerase sigma-32 factor